MKTFLLTASLALTALLAACGGGEDEKSFAKADYDKDGKVVFEELIVAYPDLTVEEYQRFDGDKGGALNQEEYAAFVAARESGVAPEPPAASTQTVESATSQAPAEQPAEQQAEQQAEQPAPPVAEAPAPESAGEPAAGPAEQPPAADAASEQAPSEPVVIEQESVEVVEVTPAPETGGEQAAPETVVVVEETETVVEPASEPVKYTIQHGDTLSRIAKKYGVSAKALMAANNIENPDHVEVGAVLVIPSADGTPTDAKAASGPAKKPAAGPVAKKGALFGEAFLVKSASDDVDGLVAMYADEVDFYQKGRVDKAFINKDKVDYFARWPERAYALTGDPVVYDAGNGLVEVVLPTRFSVKSSERTLSGEADFILVLAFDGDKGAIVSEKGKVTKRE